MPKRVLCAIAFLSFTFAGCKTKESASQAASAAVAQPVEVSVIRLQTQPFAATVSVTGTLVSRTQVEVKAQTIGKVLRFPKEEGDQVAAGEEVLWVDSENQQLAVQQAESAVQVAQAALERARVLEAHSRTEMERARNLVHSGGITEKDLKAAEVAEQEARAQVALAVAQLDQAKAALNVARKHLSDTVVRAPVSGTIQRKYVNPGAYVEAPTPVFSLVDNTRLELESPVPAVHLASLRAGQRVTFSVASFPGVTFEGRLVDVNPAVDPETRAAKVRIQVNNPGRKLKAGMFAEGEILTGVTAQSIIVPAAAVYRDDASAKSSYVFVAEDGKAVRRPVRIGREKNSELEIVEGLQPGEMLIAEQSIELADGVPVRPRS